MIYIANIRFKQEAYMMRGGEKQWRNVTKKRGANVNSCVKRLKKLKSREHPCMCSIGRGAGVQFDPIVFGQWRERGLGEEDGEENDDSLPL